MDYRRMTYLRELEQEAIYIIREAIIPAENPVVLFSMGKDSCVLAHLVKRAFDPVDAPVKFLHVDTRHKFPEMYQFRDEFALNQDLIVHKAPELENVEQMDVDTYLRKAKTEPLIEAINQYKFDFILGGARRDEEKSRAKERIFSFRNKDNVWDPRNQRPEVWGIYNTYLKEGETVRVFPLSNWTEYDVWAYIKEYQIALPTLYFSKEGKRYRSLGCMHLTNPINSDASDVDEIMHELKYLPVSERGGRVMDQVSDSTMERHKRDGYF